MKAYILHGKVHEVLDRQHPAYDFPEESWSPPPEALFEFDYDFVPYIIAQTTPYDKAIAWFDTAFLLQTVKEEKKKEFDKTFTHLETKENRPAASLSLRMASGETAFPDDDFDAGLLWTLEEIKQGNRDLLTKLNAVTIPEGGTLEKAKSIIQEAIAILPWVPAGY